MPVLAAKPREGDYYTDGLRLVYVLRVEESGNVLVEDAYTEVLLYLDRSAWADWQVVNRGS